MRVVRPVAEEMAEIDPAGLARAADQRRRHGQLMEGLVPDLDQILRHQRARADAGIGAIEEEQSPKPVRRPAGHRLRRIGADIMRDDPEALQTQRIGERQHVRRVDVGTGLIGGAGRGLLAVAEAAQVRRDHVEVTGEIGDHFPPCIPEFRPAMQQQQRRSPPLAHVVQPNPVRLNEVRFEVQPSAASGSIDRILFRARAAKATGVRLEVGAVRPSTTLPYGRLLRMRGNRRSQNENRLILSKRSASKDAGSSSSLPPHTAFSARSRSSIRSAASSSPTERRTSPGSMPRVCFSASVRR